MTTAETAEILTMVKLLWPHSNLGAPREAVAVWHELLGRFEKADIERSMRELAASGRDHAPLVGQIVKTLMDRATDAPEWDEAWAEVQLAIRKYRPPMRDENGPIIYQHESELHAAPPDDYFSHPLVAAFAIPAWRELYLGPAEGTKDYGTHHAQQREAYKAMRARAGRDAGLVAVGAPRRSSLQRLAPLEAAGLTAPALPEVTTGVPADGR